MAALYLGGSEVHSVFELLGRQENDVSYSLAWALTQCPAFLKRVLEDAVGVSCPSTAVVIRLQHSEVRGGITDIELEAPGAFHVIVEAKLGVNLPGQAQLQKYVSREAFRTATAPVKRVMILSRCRQDYVESRLGRDIAGVPIIARSWKDVALLATKARPEGSHAEKRLVDELLVYLRGSVLMPKADSNWVYVVSLSKDTPEGWSVSLVDIVRKHGRYFHKVGRNGWPADPVNYIAFRYDGRLQTIHHIDDYEVVTNVSTRIPEIPSDEWEPHFLYTLGPGFGPSRVVETGGLYRNGRVWCMLDTLFTCNTIAEARDASKAREQQAS